MCDTPCIIKIIATEDERYREVDVCQMCGAMYPRDRAPASRPVAARIVAGKPPKRRGKAKRKAKPKKKARAPRGKPRPRKKPARKARKRSARRR